MEIIQIKHQIKEITKIITNKIQILIMGIVATEILNNQFYQV